MLPIWLLVLGVSATFTISMRDPLANWLCYVSACALALFISLRNISWVPVTEQSVRNFTAPAMVSSLAWIKRWSARIIITAIAIWGFAQWVAGNTIYRYGTLSATLALTACAATAYSAFWILYHRTAREGFLAAFAWFGFSVSVLAVLAYYTSPDKVLWIFASPYPDTWGPFLSRNDFAIFLELSFPVAFWITRDVPEERRFHLPGWAPAWMLAAGFASASRAGALLLVGEAVTLLALTTKPTPRTHRKSAPSLTSARLAPWRTGKFVALVVLLASLAGSGTLLRRFQDRDPFLYRREISASTLHMIQDRPWSGFGLGTFPRVYPAYATFDTGYIVEHAHNDWLEWAAEGGILFALAWAALAGVIAAPGIRSRWALGIIAVFLHALVDYPFAKFGITSWTFALIGTLLAEGERTSSPQH